MSAKENNLNAQNDLQTVILESDDGTRIECEILFTFEMEDQEYIMLQPLNEDGNPDEDSEAYVYRCFEDENGDLSLENIPNDSEYQKVVDCISDIQDEIYWEPEEVDPEYEERNRKTSEKIRKALTPWQEDEEIQNNPKLKEFYSKLDKYYLKQLAETPTMDQILKGLLDGDKNIENHLDTLPTQDEMVSSFKDRLVFTPKENTLEPELKEFLLEEYHFKRLAEAKTLDQALEIILNDGE